MGQPTEGEGTSRTITARQLRRHAVWLDRGRHGDGQLVLDGVHLVRTQLHAMDLDAAVFRDVRFEEVHLGAACLAGASFVGCTLEGVSLLLAHLERTTWDRCTFVRGRLGVSRGEGLAMVDCSLAGAELERARWPAARLERTDLSGANLRRMGLQRAVLIDCDLRGADLTDAVLEGARLERCDLRGALLPRVPGEQVGCVG